MSKIDRAFEKPYNPQEMEKEIYALWEESGFFNPDECVKAGHTKADAEPYSIVIPPPNVTGTLHIGHIYEYSLQDVFARFHRMHGKKTLWLPGTDHAAIATQSKVESLLYKKEKKTRQDIGRDEFLKRVEQFAKESHDTIVKQIKTMGASCDWSREAYTLDKQRSLAVYTAFASMYAAELIYRGARIVNWDPKMQTTVSDDEVERVEKKGKFYYLKYGPFTIGTARPETKFGDKYVVMHPDDARYKKYKHGDTLELEWINGPITATIIKDKAIDMEFGTGVMTITPWHDTADFEIAERHNLDKEQIIDFDGKLLPIAKEFAGKHIEKARPLIVEKLKKKGLLDKVEENYIHNVATNNRGGGIIEPQIKEQWFVDVDKQFTLEHSEIASIRSGSKTTLKEIMRAAVKGGQIKILPNRFEKIYFHWIDNLRPWCISRQIWYGHRIPVWNHESKCVPIPGREDEVSKCELVVISETEPKCKHCNAKYIQDPDTLDTWFSSGLWTFSTLGWPEQTNDLKTYHPTSLMAPGYEIIFFWVARMILMSGFLLGTVPFRVVFLHGMIQDKEGRKFSKSLGTGIDPINLIELYGADALRMSLLVGASPGSDIKFDENRVRGCKHYANKIWNIARFILMSTENADISKKPELTADDQKLLEEFDAVAKSVSKDIENYRLHLAAEKLYHYIWGRLADVIIEDSKPIISGDDDQSRASRQWTLYQLLIGNLKLLHPFMPFVTEAIWQKLPEKDNDLLMVAKWPALEGSGG